MTALSAMGVAAWLLSGCASNTVYFGTNTQFGIRAGMDAKQIPEVVIGYNRQEGVMLPLVAQGTNGPVDPAAGKFTGSNGQISDSYSVLATFEGNAGGGTTNGVGANMGVAQYFATGVAAQLLAAHGASVVGGTSDNVTNIYAPDNSSAILMAYWTNNVSGTVSTAVGSAVVTGVGTKFTTSVAVGDQFAVGQLAGPLPKVINITSDTQLTVDSSYATVANGANYVVYNSQHQTAIQNWLAANKMMANEIETLMISDLMADARIKAVKDLKLQTQ